MLWGITAPAYWGDEADTVSAVSRSLPQLFRLLGHVDAVHGLYYLLLWPVVRVLGPGEFATRFPSAVAMAAATLGVAAIAYRLRSRRAALCAGLVFAVLPVVSQQGHDARPYSMVTAAAVLASYLFTRAADDPRPGRLTAYGLSLVLVGYLQLFGLLLVTAHAVALTAPGGWGRLPGGGDTRGGWPGGARGLVARRWLVTVAAAGVAVAPVAVVGWFQRDQIAWITRPGWSDAGSLVTTLVAGSAAAATVIGLLAVLGVARADARGPAWRACLGARAEGADHRLTWLAVPWLVLPPATLLLVSQLKPVYSGRYVVFCLPAAALLAGAGLAALSWPARAAAFALLIALVLPSQLAQRVPGNGMRAAAQVLRARQQPGDAVIWPGTGIQPWYLAYPDGFRQLREIGMAQSGAASGRLYGIRVPSGVLAWRECRVRRIWAVETVAPQNPAAFVDRGFRLAYRWQAPNGSVKLWLYRRAGPACRPTPLRPPTGR